MITGLPKSEVSRWDRKHFTLENTVIVRLLQKAYVLRHADPTSSFG